MSLSSVGSINNNSPDNIPTKSSRDNPYSVSIPSMPHTQNFVYDIFNLVISTQNHKGRHRMSTSFPKSQQHALPLTDSSFQSSSCSSSECKMSDYTLAMKQVFLVSNNTFICRSELGVGSCRISKNSYLRRIPLSHGRLKDSKNISNRKITK